MIDRYDTSLGTINCGDADVTQVATALADACLAGGLSDSYYRKADAALKRIASLLSTLDETPQEAQARREATVRRLEDGPVGMDLRRNPEVKPYVQRIAVAAMEAEAKGAGVRAAWNFAEKLREVAELHKSAPPEERVDAWTLIHTCADFMTGEPSNWHGLQDHDEHTGGTDGD